ncbi:MAG: hypothetical protein WCE94_12040 [Candidatus Methanoperedens sp.]
MDKQNVDLSINSIDIRKFIIIPPEVKPELVEKLRKEAENAEFELNPIANSKTHFTLDKFKVPLAEADIIIDDLNNAKEHIKEINLQTLKNEEGHVILDKKLTSLISTFIVSTNKYTNINKERVLSVLQNILSDLYRHDIEGIEFLDYETLDHLAEAAVSKKLEDAQLNLDTAMIKMLIQIRKISLLWLYDAISLNFYNLNVPREEMFKIQNMDEILLNNTHYEVIHVAHNSPTSLRRTDVLFDSLGKTLVTINTGKQTQDYIIPLMFSIFIDKASFDWRIEYANMFTTAMARAVRELNYQLGMLDLDYSKYDVQKLKEEKEVLQNGFDFLRNTLIQIKNQVEIENKSMKRYYSLTYQRNLARFLGGGISSSIRENSPLNSLDKMDILVEKMDSSIEEISSISIHTRDTLSKLIEAKEQKNVKLFEKIKNNLKDVLLIASSGANLWKLITG